MTPRRALEKLFRVDVKDKYLADRNVYTVVIGRILRLAHYCSVQVVCNILIGSRPYVLDGVTACIVLLPSKLKGREYQGGILTHC